MFVVPPLTAKIYKQLFWMRAFLHPTPKRTVLYSNTTWISNLSFAGKMKKADLETTVKTTDKYVDSQGKTRFKGNSNLRSTQHLAIHAG